MKKLSHTKTHPVAFALMGLLLVLCSTAEKVELKINQIQVIGSHNSYKQKIEAAVMQMILSRDPAGIGLDYYHIPIKEQLDLGIRGLEIDILHDPSGGRYKQPAALKLLQQRGIKTLSYDTSGALNNPGLKVLHVPDVDFRTHCFTFVLCLTEIKEWSAGHPDHLPIFITINPKDSGIKEPGFIPVLPFTVNVLDSLDQEILSVFPVSKLITPDQVKGEFAALREAITTRGWPSVSSAKGKIIFILDAGPEITDQYVKSASTGKPLFVNVPEDHSDAGFFIMNDPVRQQEDIARKVKAGFMVRTRSDADTKEARSGDYTRLNAATASGAQLISTDYYLSSLSPSGKFQITLNGKYQRCNPVTAPQDCDCKFFDDSVHDGIL